MIDESPDRRVFNVMEVWGFMLQFSSTFSWNTNKDIHSYIILHNGASVQTTRWKLSFRKSEVVWALQVIDPPASLSSASDQ